MLSAVTRARQLLHSLFPGSRMGDSASTLFGPQGALPGRKEAIPVAGTKERMNPTILQQISKVVRDQGEIEAHFVKQNTTGQLLVPGEDPNYLEANEDCHYANHQEHKSKHFCP